MNDKHINILGINVDKIKERGLLEKIQKFLYSKTGHYIVTANPEMVVLSQKDFEFRRIINNADLVVPDGIGLIFASKIFFGKDGLNERIQGVDLIYKIINNLNSFSTKKRIFFLGAKGDNAKLTALKLKKNFPNFEIAGFFGGDASEKGDRITLSIVNQARPDILFVAYGAPYQEKWIVRNLKKIHSLRLAIGVGGAFDIISGKISRAPRFVRKIGLEWLWRLINEPKRAKRIYNATIKFTWLVIKKKFVNRHKKG